MLVIPVFQSDSRSGEDAVRRKSFYTMRGERDLVYSSYTTVI
jgi:hypothetical protein